MTKVESTLASTILEINMLLVDRKVENGDLVQSLLSNPAGTLSCGKNRLKFCFQ